MAPMMDRMNTEKDSYVTQFSSLEACGTYRRPDWLFPIRKAAIARFAELGFPTRRDEAWRYTSVEPLARTVFRVAPPDACAVPCTSAEVAPHRVAPEAVLLVFVNGTFAASLSEGLASANGVSVQNLADALEQETPLLRNHLTRYARSQDHAFVALNTGLMSDGAVIHVSPHVTVEAPIQLLYLSTAQAEATFPRNLIVAEADSRVTVVETYVGVEKAPYFTNAVTEIVAQRGVAIDHYKVQRESRDAFHIAMTRIHQARDSRVSSATVSLGGALVRNDIDAVLDGEGADCTLTGLSLLEGSQHVDNHLRVEHAQPHGSSREYFKSVLDDRARGVFTGRIVVAQDAQKTDAKQTNMTLLLSDQARAESRPQLEIYADDVKCTHGATIGQVDEEAVFYLRSRGLSAQAARSLLVYAFARECLSRMRLAPLRTQLEERLIARLPQGDRSDKKAL